MKLTWQFGISFPLFVLSTQVFACMPAQPSGSIAGQGRNVVVGTVQSSKFVPRPRGVSTALLSSTNSVSRDAPELLVVVTTTEIIKGVAPATVTAVSPCSLPLPDGLRVVVATYNGRRIAFPAAAWEETFRAVNRKAR